MLFNLAGLCKDKCKKKLWFMYNLFNSEMTRRKQQTQTVREAATICPRPLQVDLWHFDLETGIRVACDVSYLCADFSLPGPFCSSTQARCTRQTDVRRASSLNAPYLQGRGRNNERWYQSLEEPRQCQHGTAQPMITSSTGQNFQRKILRSHSPEVKASATVRYIYLQFT